MRVNMRRQIIPQHPTPKISWRRRGILRGVKGHATKAKVGKSPNVWHALRGIE
jgi:hypothetical protein